MLFVQFEMRWLKENVCMHVKFEQQQSQICLLRLRITQKCNFWLMGHSFSKYAQRGTGSQAKVYTMQHGIYKCKHVCKNVIFCMCFVFYYDRKFYHTLLSLALTFITVYKALAMIIFLSLKCFAFAIQQLSYTLRYDTVQTTDQLS